jgi:hypothetical protein
MPNKGPLANRRPSQAHQRELASRRLEIISLGLRENFRAPAILRDGRGSFFPVQKMTLRMMCGPNYNEGV